MYPALLVSHPRPPATAPPLRSLHSARNYAQLLLQRRSVALKPRIKCAEVSNDEIGGSKSWEKWLPRNLFGAEKVFGAISGATSSPIAQYISSPTTFLHSVDPRIKLVYFFLFIYFVYKFLKGIILLVKPVKLHLLLVKQW